MIIPCTSTTGRPEPRSPPTRACIVPAAVSVQTRLSSIVFPRSARSTPFCWTSPPRLRRFGVPPVSRQRGYFCAGGAALHLLAGKAGTREVALHLFADGRQGASEVDGNRSDA